MNLKRPFSLNLKYIVLRIDIIAVGIGTDAFAGSVKLSLHRHVVEPERDIDPLDLLNMGIGIKIPRGKWSGFQVLQISPLDFLPADSERNNGIRMELGVQVFFQNDRISAERTGSGYRRFVCNHLCPADRAFIDTQILRMHLRVIR